METVGQENSTSSIVYQKWPQLFLQLLFAKLLSLSLLRIHAKLRVHLSYSVPKVMVLFVVQPRRK